jgi:hypothetical protein
MMWRHISILYRLTPTNETLQTLPTTVGVTVGVVRIGQAQILGAFARLSGELRRRIDDILADDPTGIGRCPRLG